MNIVHFSTYDTGGAGLAAYRLHRGLLQEGHVSRFFTLYKTRDDDTVISVSKPRSYGFKKLLNRGLSRLGVFDKDYSFYGISHPGVNNHTEFYELLDVKVDAIILHWVAEFVSPDFIRGIQKKLDVPVYWYPLDMAPMTGGCHYAWNCNGYKQDCLRCPAVNKFWQSIVRESFKNKKRVLSSMNVEVLSATSWLKTQLKSSSLFQDSCIHDLMLGVDPEIFRPAEDGERDELRVRWGIDPGTRVIFFGALHPSDRRKGFMYLVKALQYIATKRKELCTKCVLVSAGHRQDLRVIEDLGFTCKQLGYLSGELALSEAYRMADIFVNCSIEDSGPMMVNEAIMSGIPVVSFDMGVASDLVKPDRTGYVAQLGSYVELAGGIIQFLDISSSELREYKKRSRALGMGVTSTDVQLQGLLKIIGV